jgi:hypothetical protein
VIDFLYHNTEKWNFVSFTLLQLYRLHYIGLNSVICMYSIELTRARNKRLNCVAVSRPLERDKIAPHYSRLVLELQFAELQCHANFVNKVINSVWNVNVEEGRSLFTETSFYFVSLHMLLIGATTSFNSVKMAFNN